ncbi:hypothetical protein MFIFM68171_08635 [Madurella fahalii]|uniref:Uncharacterized protein n=1 Tax=Madurella fahalii TaxID=1157608 RepID=A0ABQ0GKZ1_9PEZI
MRAKALLRRLRAIFRQKIEKRAGTKRQRRNGPSTVNEPVILHQDLRAVQGAADIPKTITRAELQSSANPQDACTFFSRLPLEIRRMIYREVWSGYLEPRRPPTSSPGSDLRLHIYANGSGRGILGHTPCKVHPGDPVQEDAWVTAPWPFDNDGGSPSRMPPGWFWFAWVMRLNWGKHWKCQHAIQKRWDPLTGRAEPAEEAPFLPLFLTCKKIYLEAIVSFFENVTPVFTFSVDAHRFFIQRPHSFLEDLRSLELSFTNPNDHLYLTKRGEDTVAPPVETGTDDDNSVLLHMLARPAPRALGCTAESCPPSSITFGEKLWRTLLQGVKDAAPNVRDMNVTLAGRISRDAILAGFGEFEKHEGTTPELLDGESAPEVWKLPGKLAVTFKPDGETYVQEGSKMIRQDNKQD